MNIASFGSRARGADIEAVDFFSGRPAADFEAAFYDLEGVLEGWLEGDVFESKPHGVLSTGSYESLLAAFERRAKEMRKLVDQGHPVVLFPAVFPALKYVDRKGKWLDVPDLRSHFPASANAVRAGKGMRIEPRDLPALVKFAGRLALQSASDLVCDEKRWVLVCPRLGTPESWNDFAAAFRELYEATGADAQLPALPGWHEHYLIPGEVEVADVIAQIEKAVGELNVLLAAKREEKTRLGYLKRLFTDKGSSLNKAVRTALEGLGFEVEPGPGGDELIATYGQAVAVVEVIGKDSKSANDADASQLAKSVSKYFDEHGVVPKGILVVNGFRDTAIGTRSDAVFPDQMLGFSKKRGHCLITGLQLMCLYFDALKNNTAGRARFELLDSVGPFPRFTGEQWQSIVSPRPAAASR